MMDLLASLVQPHKHKPPSALENICNPPPLASSQPVDDFFSNPPEDQHMAEDREQTYDINAYLAANNSILETPKTKTLRTEPQPQPKRTLDVGYPEPVQLGVPKSSHHVELLHRICQEKMITPVFEIEADPNGISRYTGTLTIEGKTIALGRTEATKKEVRQGLAEMALDFVKEMPGVIQKPEDDLAIKNWIGKLEQFCKSNCTSATVPPTFTDFAVGRAYACECTIAQHPTPFGSRNTPFANKKLAKAAAAKAAVEYLIQAGYLLPDGSVPPKPKKTVAPQPKLRKPGAPPMLVTEKSEEEKSWGQRVAELAFELGLGTPEYRFAPADPVHAPSLYNGAAYFTGSVFLEGPQGEVRGVFGRKKAKEECAEVVWEKLDGIRKVRLGES